jgi:hypothetical protein
MKSFKRHLEEKLKASDDMGDWVKDFQDSDAPQFKGKSMKKRQQMAVAAKLGAERNEEVELDEVSDKKLDAYRQKAFADQPAGDDGSDKYRKRKFGRDLAFAKQTGRAKVLATKEEVELDEVSTEKLRDYASSALQDKNKAKADKRWKYASKAMKTVGDREAKAAHARKYNKMEEVGLEENIGGLFKNASEWEKSAKARGLVVKSSTHPSGEATKYQIAKDKQGNNRGHFDHGTRSGRLKE